MAPKKQTKKAPKKAPKKPVKKSVKKAPAKKVVKKAPKKKVEEVEELDEMEEELDVDAELEGEDLEDFEIEDMSDEDEGLDDDEEDDSDEKIDADLDDLNDDDEDIEEADDDLDLDVEESDDEEEGEELDEDEEEGLDDKPEEEIKPKKKVKKVSSEDKLESFDDFMKDDEDEEEQQQLFDDDMLDENPRKKKKRSGHDIPLKLYRRIALGFIVITGALLLFMLVFSATSATINITPEKEQISVSLLRTVAGTTDRIEGVVFVEEITYSESFSVEEGKEVEGNASGQMRIINNSSETVSLIPRTRFQSADGVIFRIAERVIVNAGKEATAKVTADVVGTAGDVAQGKFTIPGLPTAQQAEIFGESVSDMSGGVRIAGVLAESDIERARSGIAASLKQSKLDQYRDNDGAQSYPDNIASVEVLSETINGEIGSEVDQFSIDVRANVTAVFFDGSALDTLTRQAVFAKVPSDKRLHKVGDPRYEVEKVDAEAKTATLKLTREGTVIVDPGSDIVAPSKFTNLDESAIETYMDATGLIDNWDVQIRPRWRNKTPGTAERIKVKVNVE